MAETSRHTFTIAKQPFELNRDRIERAVRHVLPEPVASHYVVIGNRRYPPKQVIGLVTGLDRADFTSHQARRILMGLGFAVGRRRIPTRREDGPTSMPGVSAHTTARTSHSGAHSGADERELAETLRSFRGEWVATKDGELLVAAPTPKELVGWLSRYGRRADSMFRVPEDELALGGFAPL
jgi:hypothetical protein